MITISASKASTTIINDEEVAAAVEQFDRRCTDSLAKIVERQQLWRGAVHYGIDIPYDSDRDASNFCYHNIAQYEPYDSELDTTALDVKATQVQFARIIRWARKNGWSVEKKYDDEKFKIIVSGDTLPYLQIHFYSTRQVVCKKVQIGTKVVPAVPEHEEPEYEYQCDKVAFLSVEV